MCQPFFKSIYPFQMCQGNICLVEFSIFFKGLRGNLSHCILEQKKHKSSVKTPRMTESIVRIGTF